MAVVLLTSVNEAVKQFVLIINIQKERKQQRRVTLQFINYNHSNSKFFFSKAILPVVLPFPPSFHLFLSSLPPLSLLCWYNVLFILPVSFSHASSLPSLFLLFPACVLFPFFSLPLSSVHLVFFLLPPPS